jgi:hypothetical protein
MASFSALLRKGALRTKSMPTGTPQPSRFSLFFYGVSHFVEDYRNEKNEKDPVDV